MLWNWFPINAAAAIQSRLHRRALLDSIRVNAENEFATEGAIDNLSMKQAQILKIVLESEEW